MDNKNLIIGGLIIGGILVGRKYGKDKYNKGHRDGVFSLADQLGVDIKYTVLKTNKSVSNIKETETKENVVNIKDAKKIKKKS